MTVRQFRPAGDGQNTGETDTVGANFAPGDVTQRFVGGKDIDGGHVSAVPLASGGGAGGQSHEFTVAGIVVLVVDHWDTSCSFGS